MINRLGAGRIRAYSAGSQPKGQPHPGALRLLSAYGFDLDAFRSKSWNEFAGPGAPTIDLAITVCGNAAGEACPLFRGAPLRAHWGLPDPANAIGDEAQIDAAFAETWRLLELRVKAMLEIDLAALDQTEALAALADIGAMEGAA